MHLLKDTIRLLICLTRLTKNYNLKSGYYLFFTYYALLELNALLKMRLKLYCIPDDIFSILIRKHKKCTDSLVDNNLYILCNSDNVDKSKTWYNLCSKKSRRKYKVFVIFTNDILENHIYVSKNMKLNINKKLYLNNFDTSTYFLIPALNEPFVQCATEVTISLISNPHQIKDDLINKLLKQFFISPKYLRIDDIFSVNVLKYMPEIKYSASMIKLKTLHFKVNSVLCTNQEAYNDGCLAVYGKTTLIQTANINSYLPPKCICDIPFDTEKCLASDLPPVLQKYLEQMQLCIAPFLQKDIHVNIKPIFLVEGPSGTGKYQLIKIIAEVLGLHLLIVNCFEIQCTTSGQSEAKLKAILEDAEKCTPCILMLRNIQIFGINSDGQKDERILSTFATEIHKLYNKRRQYPIIIIATSDNSEKPIALENTFLEKIIITDLEEEERYKMLCWFVENKHLKHKADLQEISKMCSGFVLADIEALVLHAIKNRYKIASILKDCDIIELLQEDFIFACKYIKSLFSKEISKLHVPTVHWEDIGGLTALKHEIIRRIKMPLLNIPGLNKSGLLLYGPPGTGKTLLAKAVATECQLNFISVKGPELLNMYVGQSEKNVRQVFERARAASPCIIFFDELDSLAPSRGQSGDSGGVMDRVVSQLLAEMDGVEDTKRVMVIAATNRPDLVDPALLRPGRFDKLLYVGVCSDPESRLNILRTITRRFNMQEKGQRLEALAHRMPDNLTGADLYSVCTNAWMAAVRRLITSREDEENLSPDDVVVTMEDFERASKDHVPSVSKEELLRYEKLKNRLLPSN